LVYFFSKKIKSARRVTTGARWREKSMLRGIRASAGRVDEEEGSDNPGSWRCRINDGKNNRSDQYTADITNVSWDGIHQ
jgi:hypothetical protein